jgi:hypothetical protein
VIETGPVTIGRDAFVGEATLLEIGTTLGDGAQLGHSSSLMAGQSIPAGERRIGSPAETRTEANYLAAPQPRRSRLRRATYSFVQLLILGAVTLPIGLLVPLWIAEHPVWTPAFEGSSFAPMTIVKPRCPLRSARKIHCCIEPSRRTMRLSRTSIIRASSVASDSSLTQITSVCFRCRSRKIMGSSAPSCSAK